MCNLSQWVIASIYMHLLKMIVKPDTKTSLYSRECLKHLFLHQECTKVLKSPLSHRLWYLDGLEIQVKKDNLLKFYIYNSTKC